jgi:hypothetical protein
MTKTGITPTVMDWMLSQGVAMKATIAALAAFFISGIAMNSASAQNPYQYPVMPMGYGYPGYATVPPTGGPVASASGGSCAAGGCTTGGCSTCGKPTLLSKLGLTSSGCNSCGGAGACAKCKSWLCRPFPSNAPVLRKPDYPLGFPTNPYVRSPRDYFMWQDP